MGDGGDGGNPTPRIPATQAMPAVPKEPGESSTKREKVVGNDKSGKGKNVDADEDMLLVAATLAELEAQEAEAKAHVVTAKVTAARAKIRTKDASAADVSAEVKRAKLNAGEVKKIDQPEDAKDDAARKQIEADKEWLLDLASDPPAVQPSPPSSANDLAPTQGVVTLEMTDSKGNDNKDETVKQKQVVRKNTRDIRRKGKPPRPPTLPKARQPE